MCKQSPIRHLRKELGMSQVEFARVLKIGQSSISLVESGLSALPVNALDAMKRLHWDIDFIVRKQREFMESRRRVLEERARAAAGTETY